MVLLFMLIAVRGSFTIILVTINIKRYIIYAKKYSIYIHTA